MTDETVIEDDDSPQEGKHTNGTLADHRDVVDIRVPPKPEFLPVLRAAVGVIAGGMSFTYDEIMQLRVALSEAFEMSTRHLGTGERGPEAAGLTASLRVRPDRLELLITNPNDGPKHRNDNMEAESKALLESLVDELELRDEGDGRVIRLVKYKSAKAAR